MACGARSVAAYRWRVRSETPRCLAIWARLAGMSRSMIHSGGSCRGDLNMRAIPSV